MNLDLLGVFGAGAATFLTPCVLPMIPLYLAALVGGDLEALSREGRGRVMFRAGLFAAGFVLVFTVLGLGATAAGSFLADNRLVLQIVGAVLILVFGLHFLGVARIPWFDRVVKADDAKLRTRSGGVNAFVMGVVFAAGWSPCVGPVLGSVLTYTASTASSPVVGAGYLALYGLGFALPLLATAALAEAGLRLLRRVRPHLHRIERAVGALLVAVSVSMLLTVVPELRAGSADPAAVVPADGKPTMLALVSADCPVCEGMKPLLREMTERCDGKNVHLRMVDVSQDEHRGLIRAHRLVGVPTFLFLDREGAEVARLVGRQSEEALTQALSALRGESCAGVGLLPGVTPVSPEGEGSGGSATAAPAPSGAEGEACRQAALFGDPPPAPGADSSAEACGTPR